MRVLRFSAVALLLSSAVLLVTAMTPEAHASSVPQIVDDFGPTGTEIGITTQNRAIVTWSPTLEFYMLYDRHVKSNAVEVTLLKGGEKQGDSWVCGSSSSIKAYQTNQTTGLYPYPLSSFSCSAPKQLARTDSGRFQLALKYKEPLAGKEHDLGTLEFAVLEIAHGAPSNTQKTFAVSWDHMLGTAKVFESISSNDLKSIARTVTRASYQDRGIANEVSMSFWTKYEKESDPGRQILTCLKDGEVIAESRPGTGQTFGYWTYNPDKSKSVVKWKQQTFTFMQFFMRRKSPEAHRGGMNPYWLSENPGEYRCVATASGTVTAELRFAVDAEGDIVGRDCGDEIVRPDTLTEVHFEEKATTSFRFDAKARNAPYFGRAQKAEACRI